MKKVWIAIAAMALMGTPAFAGGHGHGEHAKHWGYEGDVGPAHWGQFSETCAKGKSQSPINIETAKVVKKGLQPIEIHYSEAKAVKGKVLNNGHTIKVETENGGYIVANGKRFDLLQFHFHSPSENQVDGKPYDMVAHFVHKAKDGQLAVIAVMFEKGKSNAALRKVWKKMPKEVGESAGYRGLNLNAILPKDRSYYHFTGSLTTPPCSENVEWFVLKHPVSIGAKQLSKFHKLYNGNVRPTNPLNGRVVEE
ncbi:MAG: carbonic anhydrase family protein [Zetaproteobacteria bacterium]|nr:MAG: carbonic anhydrase family protein [Zetaproteobacteria bacterium]